MKSGPKPTPRVYRVRGRRDIVLDKPNSRARMAVAGTVMEVVKVLFELVDRPMVGMKS